MLLAGSLAVVVASRGRPFGASVSACVFAVGLHPRLLRVRYFVARAYRMVTWVVDYGART